MNDALMTALIRKALILVGLAVGPASLVTAIPASAAPGGAPSLTSPSLTIEHAAHKRLKTQQSYLEDSAVVPSYPSYPRSSRGMPFGGSDEVLELQRQFPSTLWPRSMRYFPYP